MMRKPAFARLIGVWTVSAMMCAAGPALSQQTDIDQTPPQKNSGETKVEKTPPSSGTGPGASDADKTGLLPKALKSAPGPETEAQRRAILSDLYERLSSAASAENANLVETAIERVRLHSGSDTIDLLMARAMKLHSDDKNGLAIDLLDAVVSLEPGFAEGWNRRAFLHFEEGSLLRAASDLSRVLDIDPRHFRAMSGLATIMRELGDKASALKAFRRLREIHPYWESVDQTIKELARDVEGQDI